MARLDFHVERRGFESLPQYGEGHPVVRLCREASFPLFDPDGGARSSGSPFMDRAAAAGRLAAMNPDMPPPPPDAVYVIAGQQPGLLLGPLYTFLKAAGTVALAGRLSREWALPVLPLFWVASEDHDVLEVNRVTVGGERFVHPHGGPIERGKVPQVGEIPIEGAREPLLAFLRRTLPETEYTPWILDAVAGADYGSYGQAFSSLMGTLFNGMGLRIADPIRLRPVTAPVLAALVQAWPEVRRAFDQGTAAVEAAGIEPPLHAPGLFEIVDGNRVPVALSAAEGAVTLSTGTHTFAEAAAEILSRPVDFSPGAGLRPVLQDGALPTAATMAGPTELCYLWQIQSVYGVIGAAPSRLLPRVSATFVEDKILRAAEKAGLGREKLFETRSLLEDREKQGREKEADDPAGRGIREKTGALISEIDRAAPGASGEEPKWLKKGKAAIEAQVDKIARRLREERLAAQGLGRSRLEKVAESILPGGKPQERVQSVVPYLNHYGPDFVRLAVEKLDPLDRGHQVVFLKSTGGGASERKEPLDSEEERE